MATATRSPAEYREFEEEFIAEVWNDQSYGMIDEHVSDDFVGHWFDPETGDVDRDGLRSFIEAVHAGFSDFHMDAEFMIAEDDMIAVGFTTTATHDGEFMGIPATGATGGSPGIFVHRFDDDGLVVETWATWDALGLMQELGVVPETFSLASFLETGAHLAKADVLKRTKGK